MKARLARYGLWQARDFVIDRALAILFTGAAVIFVSWQMFTAGSHAAIARGGLDAQRFGAVVLKGIVELVWIIIPLLAVRGISADDRKEGRYRLLFAKPVSVPRFYAQAFAIHGVLAMMCGALVVAGTRIIVPLSPISVRGALMIFLASYLLVGGLLFLFSAVWRWDWLATGVVLAGAMYLAGEFPKAAWLKLLPPAWEIGLQLRVLQEMQPLDWRPLLWACGYGVACFLLGLIVLRRRPLAT
ncbi:MAG TPA: hypothetical protein VF761_17605 [Gemmatimonadaceae bacterium]